MLGQIIPNKKKVVHTIIDKSFYKQSMLALDSFIKYNNEEYDVIIFAYGDLPEDCKYKVINIKEYSDKTYKGYNTVQKIKAFRAKSCIQCLKKYEGTLYIDSDLYFYDKIPDYNKTTFTLHDNYFKLDLVVLKWRYSSGFINLGYAYFNKDEETMKWLELYDKLYKNKTDKITTLNSKIWNQIFYNFMPWIFQNYDIDKNDGLNIAFWNINERNITQKDGIYYSNNDKLICIHFSRLNDELKKKNKNETLKKLINEYEKLIK